MAMLLVVVSVMSVAPAVEIDSASLLQSRGQKATTRGTVLHSEAYLDAAVAHKNKAPSYSGSPTVIAESNLNGCQGLDRSIDNLDECKQLALVHHKKFHKVGSWTDRPGGCFAVQLSAPASRGFRAGRVYFNQNPGGRETNSAPICKVAVCDFYECPQHYTKKPCGVNSGSVWDRMGCADWTRNPRADVCCHGLCKFHICPPGYVKRLFQDSVVENADDSKCCKKVDTAQSCLPTNPWVPDGRRRRRSRLVRDGRRRRRHNPVEYATVVCGPCVVTSALCVTSSNWPSNYGNNERCEIHMPRTPLDVIDFDTEASLDEFEVNNYDFQGTRADQLNGQIVDGPIEWTSDRSVTKTGWKICATNTNTCILWECPPGYVKRLFQDSVENPDNSKCCKKVNECLSTSAHDGRRRRHNPVEYATVVCGPCVVTGVCVTSSNWPSKYGNNERCEIHMPRTPINVIDFDTAANDKLEVNNYDIQGTQAYQINGRIADGPIEWTSDSSVTKTGWKICAPR